MTEVANASAARRFEIRLRQDHLEEVTQPRMRTLIRTGTVIPSTSVRERGTEQWTLAGDVEELRPDFDAMAGQRAGDSSERISRTRLVAYMALAGLVAGGVMMILAPLCLLIGVFAKFVLTWAAFGAVLALGVTNAAKINEPRIVHLTAAGFAAGGLLAWFLHAPDGEFTPLHLAIIGLAGGAALSYAIRLQRQRAILVTAAAAVLFPIAIFSIRLFTPGNLRISLPGFWVLLVIPLVMFIPVIPFAVFGGVIGSLIDWSGADD